MYTSYFGFSQQPFSNADTRLLLQRPKVAAIYERLSRGLEQGWGLLLLTGPAGTGKAALLRRLRTDFQGRAHCVALWNAHLEWPDLLAYLAEQLGAPGPVAPEKLPALVDYRPLVVMISDAHQLPDSSLTGLGQLLAPGPDGRPPLCLVLVGPPELERRLSDNPELAARVALHCHLEPWDQEDLRDYVRARLVEAGREDGLEVFEPDALDKGLTLAEGLPRRADLIFNQALLLAYLNSEHRVPDRFVRRVAEARTPAPAPAPAASPLEAPPTQAAPPAQIPPEAPQAPARPAEPPPAEPILAKPPAVEPPAVEPAPAGLLPTEPSTATPRPPDPAPAVPPDREPEPPPAVTVNTLPDPDLPPPASPDPFASRRAVHHHHHRPPSRRRPRRRFGLVLSLLLLLGAGGALAAWYLDLPLDPRRIDWSRTVALLEQLPGMAGEPATTDPARPEPPPPMGAQVTEQPLTLPPPTVGEIVEPDPPAGQAPVTPMAPPQEPAAPAPVVDEPVAETVEEAVGAAIEEPEPAVEEPAVIETVEAPATVAEPEEAPEPGGTPPAEPEAVETPAEPEQPPALTPEQSATIARLLESARQQMAAMRYTVPAGDNATETYRQVLALDPDNETALAGIRTIKSDFLRWADYARQRGEIDKARRQLQTALEIDPQDSTIREQLETLPGG